MLAENTAPVKRLYSYRRQEGAVRFSRRNQEYHIETDREDLLDALPYLQARLSLANVAKITGISRDDLSGLLQYLAEEDLLDREKRLDTADKHDQVISGPELYRVFRDNFDDWMQEAFSAPYWQKMLSGEGSRELFIGYLLELYHYTRNANRHMPLVVSTCNPAWKNVKRLLATHYKEEWNHYAFFQNALAAMGLPKQDVIDSDPLPSTLEMSNFMRQCARTSTICYAICSAILEGTTEDGDSYRDFFREIAQLYDIPDAAIKPIYDHLDLDAQYGHESLFKEICGEVSVITVADAQRVLSTGKQMIDHIFLWTDHIDQYYGDPERELVRRKFDINYH